MHYSSGTVGGVAGWICFSGTWTGAAAGAFAATALWVITAIDTFSGWGDLHADVEWLWIMVVYGVPIGAVVGFLWGLVAAMVVTVLGLRPRGIETSEEAWFAAALVIVPLHLVVGAILAGGLGVVVAAVTALIGIGPLIGFVRHHVRTGLAVDAADVRTIAARR